MSVQINSPFHIFYERDGSPLEAGFIFIGAANLNPQTNPIPVFWDEDMTIPAAQPIRTLNGFPSRSGTPSIIYAAPNDYSITTLDKNGALVFSALSATAIPQFQQDLADVTDPSLGAALIGRGAQVVDSISELRDLLKTSPSQTAFVLGYYAPGDGGGGPYAIDPLDFSSADNGGTIIVADDGARWKLMQNGWIDVRQFGAKGDGAADDTAALAAVQAFVATQITHWLTIFNTGIYCYTESPNWAKDRVRVEFRGHVVFRNKGTGHGVILDAGPNALDKIQDFVFGHEGNPVIIESPKGGKSGIFARGLLAGTKVAAIVRGAGTGWAGLQTQFCVLTTFHVEVSSYTSGWYDDGTGPAKPTFGFLLQERSAGEQTSYCLFIDPIAITTEIGFQLDSTLGNVFIGGDAEFNTTAGAILTANARNNKFHGTNFEVNGTGGFGFDVNCGGFDNEFICDTSSNGVNGGFRFTGGRGNKLKGGVHDFIGVEPGVVGSYIGEVTYQRGLSGNLQIADLGTGTSYGRNWAAQEQKYTYGPSVVANVVLGPSPFTFTNTTGMPQRVYITGGTGVTLEFLRGATLLGRGVTDSQVTQDVGDSMKVTFTVAPVVNTASMR